MPLAPRRATGDAGRLQLHRIGRIDERRVEFMRTAAPGSPPALYLGLPTVWKLLRALSNLVLALEPVHMQTTIAREQVIEPATGFPWAGRLADGHVAAAGRRGSRLTADQQQRHEA